MTVIWLLGADRRMVFLGDQVYDRKHGYLADGFYEEWLGNLERLAHELPVDATLQIGHGGPVTRAHFDRQREYVETFLDAVRTADWSEPETASAAVVERMTHLLPTDEAPVPDGALDRAGGREAGHSGNRLKAGVPGSRADRRSAAPGRRQPAERRAEVW